MRGYIAQISLLVRDYDEAIEFYVRRLGFELVQDTVLTPSKRWVVIRPASFGGRGCHLLLAKASTPEQEKLIGRQSGGRVWLFLNTDDFDGCYQLLLRQGIEITDPPRNETYGRVLVFADLYGNRWDLIEPVSFDS